MNRTGTTRLSRPSRNRRARARFVAIAAVGLAALSAALTPGAAGAHPLGNFTTNTATRLVVGGDSTSVLYVVDLAEIPSLKIRQQLGAVTGEVPGPVASQWRDEQCATLGRGLSIFENEAPLTLTAQTSSVAFPSGQAGLTTIRLECNFVAKSSAAATASGDIRVLVSDANFADRLGWREITAVGNGTALAGTVAAFSPTKLLTTYAKVSAGRPLHQVEAAFSARPSAGSSTQVAPTTSASAPTRASTVSTSRGNDGLTQRFQSLVARRHLTFPFAVGALLLAMVLGGFHAMAPGHGKTIMAAYAVSRRGSKGDIASIGLTVALTHTIGILILGSLVSATSVVSPDRTLRWASVVSGVLVVGVGVTLVRGRLVPILARRASRLRSDDHGHPYEHPHAHAGDHGHEHPRPHSHEHPHPHADDHRHEHGDHEHPHADDHGHEHPRPHSHEHPHPHPHADDHRHEHGDHGDHDHPHPHAHDHGHEHPHPHNDDHDHPHPHPHTDDGVVTTAHPANDRYIVTSHSHGGWQHEHVLPAPGALVRRRELVVMGLAGGIVPSPSALVVLLAAIALGRVPFGIGLVVAYGIGLAGTLVAAGLLLVRFERRLRRWTASSNTMFGLRLAGAVNVLPLISGLAIVGAGLLLVVRSLSSLS